MRLYASLCVVWCKSVYFCAIWYIYTINYATIRRAYFRAHQMTTTPCIPYASVGIRAPDPQSSSYPPAQAASATCRGRDNEALKNWFTD